MTVVVAILVLLVSLYLVVNYQHPEDRNQAWIPKIVVLLGFAVAFWTILLFPLDVANQQACALDVPLSSCETTLPMTQLWYAVYIAAMAITFVAVPFSIFYYEADSDWWVGVGGAGSAATVSVQSSCMLVKEQQASIAYAVEHAAADAQLTSRGHRTGRVPAARDQPLLLLLPQELPAAHAQRLPVGPWHGGCHGAAHLHPLRCACPLLRLWRCCPSLLHCAELRG